MSGKAEPNRDRESGELLSRGGIGTHAVVRLESDFSNSLTVPARETRIRDTVRIKPLKKECDRSCRNS